MITRVLDAHGNVLHDCDESRCQVAWDGVALVDHDAVDHTNPDPQGNPKVTRVKRGDKVPGAAEPDAGLYDVRGRTAQLKTHT